MHYFFPLIDVLEIHQKLIENYGGHTGVRDEELLQSALAQVSMTFEGVYLHKTIYEMAAAYLFHIAKNHPFVDGNKRTGITLAVLFLSRDGIEINCSEESLADFVISVAGGRVSKNTIARWFEENSIVEE